MLKQRIVTAIVLFIGLIAAIFYLPPLYWEALMALVSVVAAWEWGRLAGLQMRGRLVFSALMLLACLGMMVFSRHEFNPESYRVLCVAAVPFWCLVVPFWIVRRWRLSQTAWGRYPLLFLGFCLILSTWAAFIVFRGLHPGLLLWALGLVWVSDISAYFAGRKFGGRKLAPEISPGKTWAGVYGALAGVLVYGVASIGIIGMDDGKLPPWLSGVFFVLFMLLLAVLGILGDLFESLLKRQAGVKDSGNLLPGHGGVLDRIDSLMAVLPCFLPLLDLMPDILMQMDL
ncbi:MAG: phosphatidate cytidylyltransferase [Zoogloeaceae bacterium]|jgi:phosphatidate cytidylyltransferase|nr:phosphatidate cytidylyltransferase [Zoogloeaceae bacterium]